MDLIDTLRTTGAVREFTEQPVPDEVLVRVLDTARFAPSGGNRQAWRVVVVRDPETRRQLRDLYLADWYEYLAMGAAGLTPWAPITDREAEARAVAQAPTLAAQAGDRDLARYTFAGGASIYPFVWNLLLAARAEGLAGVLTTMAIRQEAEVKALLGAPDELALATVVALGYPVRQPRRLRRAPVASFATFDRVDGPAVE